MSTDYDFNMTAQQIIKRAYNHLNVYGSTEEVSADDLEFALDTLNLLIKEWQADGLHLWIKKTGVIFFQWGRNEYILDELPLSGNIQETHHNTTYFTATTLAADVAPLATSITVNTLYTEVNIGDYIGIESTSINSTGNRIFLAWRKITNLPGGNVIEFTPGLLSNESASSGNVVYTFNEDDIIREPFNIYSATRLKKPTGKEKQDILSWGSGIGIDTPMNQISYQQYLELPNKDNGGVPVSYNYDRQLGKGVIRVWPTPKDQEYLMKITYAKQLKDVDIVTDTVEFPKEWLSAIIFNLAVDLGPAFGKAGTQDFAALQNRAQTAYQRALSFDSEQGSIFFRPDYQGYKGYPGSRYRGK